MKEVINCRQGRRKQSGGGTWQVPERERITGVWGQSPQRGPKAEPMVRGSDAVLAPRHPQEGQNRPICMLRAASANCRLSCATA